MSLVVDASDVTAALVDGGAAGIWSAATIEGAQLLAPHLMPVEVANVLRRAEAASEIARDTAALAHADLLALPTAHLPFAPFAERCRELRGAVSTYDAWYVAIAEEFGVPLATPDGRLLRVPGPRCSFVSPDAGA